MRIILVCLLAAGAVFGQTQIKPDCDIQFSLTASGQRSAVTGCGQNAQGVTDWRVVYFSNGFSGLTLTVQDAPDNNGVPGTWVTWAGTVVEGSNPMTSTLESNVRVSGYFPWASVSLSGTTGSGTVVGHLYGCRDPGCSALQPAGSGSGCTSPCVVIGPDAPGAPPTQNPVELGAFDGVNTQRVRTDVNGRLQPGAYPSLAQISLSASGLTRIITHSGTSTTTIGHVSFSFTGGVTTVQFESGTGSNCGTGTAPLSGIYQSVATIALDVPIPVPAGQDVCVNLGSTLTGGGMALYAQP